MKRHEGMHLPFLRQHRGLSQTLWWLWSMLIELGSV